MRTSRFRTLQLASVAAAIVASCGGGARPNELRIPTGAGGVGFLPLLMMREHGLIENHARAAGIPDVEVRWIEIGGPAVMNDALLSGSVDFIAAGPPGFLTLWDRTRDSAQVKGVAAMTSLPMYLNTHAEHLRSLDDLTDEDKIAVTAIKVSIPAIIMQMYATDRYGAEEAYRFDRHTVTMTHPDGVVALLSGSSEVNAHYTSPPFHHREREDPSIRTIMTTNDVMGGATTFTMMSTTARFHDENPELYAAVLSALTQANEMIRADLGAAADVLIAANGGGGFDRDALVDVLGDPEIRFTTTPENVMKYAGFMHGIGSIANLPDSWRDLFFPGIHDAPGG
ncbi:ABC transporter substrate-binding protein [Candidatus Rariloculus sp.]|uniref:ABC transporter substrate-binding protein n=1 Tax=Candidatus Rariloculus sp. TaxID=3101265 RepID=UPI003D0E842E